MAQLSPSLFHIPSPQNGQFWEEFYILTEKTYFKPLIIHNQLRKYLSNIKNKKKIFGKIVPMVGGTPTTKLLLGADNIYSEKGVGGQKFWGKC